MKKKLVKKLNTKKEQKSVVAFGINCNPCGSVPSNDYINVYNNKHG